MELINVGKNTVLDVIDFLPILRVKVLRSRKEKFLIGFRPIHKKNPLSSLRTEKANVTKHQNLSSCVDGYSWDSLIQ